MQSVKRKFLKYLIPSIFSMLVVSAYSFADTFVVGRALGAPGLAAIGIATPVLTALFSLGHLFGTGGGAVYAIMKGKGEKEEAGRLYTHGFLLAVATGIAVILFGTMFIEKIAVFLGADESNLELTIEYMRWLFFFAPLLILDLTTNHFMRNEGRPGVAMAATMIGSGANVVLDLLFVLVFGWGIFGASIATCMGSVIAVLINVGYSVKNRLGLRFCRIHVDISSMKRIIVNGLGAFILNFSVAVLTLFYISEVKRVYGNMGVSAYTILMNWNLIFMNMLLGVAQSSQPLISLSYGKGEISSVRSYYSLTLCSALIMAVCFLPLGIFFSQPLSLVFVSNSQELVALAAWALQIAIFTYPFMAATMTIGYYFEALEQSRESLAIMLARGCLIPVVMLYVLARILGGWGIWISIPAAELLAMLFAVGIKRAKPEGVSETVHPAMGEKDYVILTISREFGSGGREIGKRLAEILQIPFYDKKVRELTAAESGLADEIILHSEERQDKGVVFGLYRNNRYIPISDKVYLAQRRAIEQIASQGTAIIVGRCADSILRGRYRCLNVFIHAPLELRISRVMEYDKCTEKEAREKILESDAARAAYHDYYTGEKWGRAKEYDLTINSGMGFNYAVSLIAQMYRAAADEKISE